LSTYQNNPHDVSVQALPLIPTVLIFYIAPAMIQIIGEITLKVVQQIADERYNRELYFSQIVPMNYNHDTIKSILRHNFCITSNGYGRPIHMEDCVSNNSRQLFKAEIIDRTRLIYIIKTHDGFCLDVAEMRRSNGANIISYHCHEHDNQKWVKDIVHRFHPLHAFDKCLDISQSSIQNFANIILYTCNAHSSNQKWI
jgi:hypothetical protein